MNFLNILDTRLNVTLILHLIREEHKLNQIHLNTCLIVLHLITIKHLNCLPDKDEFDAVISLVLTRKWTKDVLNNRDKNKHFRNNDTFDNLDLTEHVFYHMNLRVLRFKISEEDYECILTNLPWKEFSVNEIKKLHAMRWGIATSFSELKYTVGLTGFHAKKREYIIQGIWVCLILYNFCEIITSHVTIEKCRGKHTYQINYTFAIHICRYFISKMAEKSPPDVEALISKEILPVRPERHNPRKATTEINFHV